MLLDELLVNRRIGLIKYILYHYQIDNKETVWILNYLKDHYVIKHIRLMPPNDLTIGLTLTSKYNLFMEHESLILSQADVIFNLIDDIKEGYFHILIEDDKIKKMMVLEQFVYSMDQRKVPNVSLDSPDYEMMFDYVEDKIEISLLLNDKEHFEFYTTILRRMKG